MKSYLNSSIKIPSFLHFVLCRIVSFLLFQTHTETSDKDEKSEKYFQSEHWNAIERSRKMKRQLLLNYDYEIMNA